MPEFEVFEDPEDPFAGLPTTVYQYKDNDGIINTLGAVSVKNEEALAIAFILDPTRHRKGIGKMAFLQAYQKYSVLYNIKYIIGKWKMDSDYSSFENSSSTNLTIFNTLRTEGLSSEEAAIKTPTGKWAASIGYNKVKIIREEEEWVEINFYQDLPNIISVQKNEEFDFLD